MQAKSVFLGVVLLILGVVSYILTGAQSATALIPAIFGIPVLLLSWSAKKEKWHRSSIHAILILALLGFLGSVSGAVKAVVWLTGGDIARPAAVFAQTLMALLCAWYIYFGIRSFIEARRSVKPDQP
jgi:hypothetical protein